MEINKKLFEDVLAGKLKGTFVLRNGITVNSDKLFRTGVFHPGYAFEGMSYIFDCNGETPILGCSIIDFIPDTDMKQNELTIEIPDGKIVDWEESKKQNKIVLKDKQLTYEDVCEKLFKDSVHYTDVRGRIISNGVDSTNVVCVTDANNATTEHQLECIIAKNKLANVAKYLNDGWKPLYDDSIYLLIKTESDVSVFEVMDRSCASDCGSIWFKSEAAARQAIEILGEETVKLALEPLGI